MSCDCVSLGNPCLPRQGINPAHELDIRSKCLLLNLASAAPCQEAGGLDSEGRPALGEVTDPLLLGVALCSTSSFDRNPKNLALPISQRATFGNATESGLLRFVSDRVPVDELREKHPVVSWLVKGNRMNSW